MLCACCFMSLPITLFYLSCQRNVSCCLWNIPCKICIYYGITSGLILKMSFELIKTIKKCQHALYLFFLIWLSVLFCFDVFFGIAVLFFSLEGGGLILYQTYYALLLTLLFSTGRTRKCIFVLEKCWSVFLCVFCFLSCYMYKYLPIIRKEDWTRFHGISSWMNAISVR